MPVTRRHRDILVATSLLTYLLVVLGGVVCITNASRGCPDWPGCYGRLVPPLRLDSILEYSHRLLAALVTLSILASAVLGWRNARSIRWVSGPPMVAVVFLLAVIVFGAMVVLRGLEPGLAALDLGSALMVLALMVTAAVAAASRHENPNLLDKLFFDCALAKLALGTLVAVFIVLVSGVLVAESGSVVRCLGWPLYGGQLDLGNVCAWFQQARRLFGGLAGLLLIAVVVQAWRLGPGERVIRRTAAALGLLFLAQTVVGVLILVTGFSALLYTAYAAAAAALWSLLVVMVVLAGLASSGSARESP